jgi:glycine cleavage system H lipoate-binding protein
MASYLFALFYSNKLKLEIMVLLIFVVFIVLCISVDAMVQFSRKRKSKAPVFTSVSSHIFNEATVAVPKGLYYNKTHTWAFREKNGLVKIGIDDFLLHITGPLSRVKMKQPGEQIRKGEPAITIIQNGKQLVINAPVSGTVKYQNIQLLEDISLINSSPVHDGWIYAIEPSNWEKESQFLIMAEKYKDWLKNEISRLKDFLAYNRQTNNTEFIPVMLQDGGELKDNLLLDFGPEVWEDFQIKFINISC